MKKIKVNPEIYGKVSIVYFTGRSLVHYAISLIVHLYQIGLEPFFQEKITKIREILDTKDCSGEQVNPHYTPPNFPKFTTIYEDEVRKLISSSPNKSCDLDPCPTSTIKECVDLLAKPIATIINASISQGVFPQYFKQAHVTPLLKKSSLSGQELKNFRPVSNLNYVSKLMKKVVANQIKGHVDGFGLDNSLVLIFYCKISKTRSYMHRQ